MSHEFCHLILVLDRYTKELKKYVKNKARAEGCMTESYLAKEYVNFINRDDLESSVVGERFLRYDNSREVWSIGASKKYLLYRMDSNSEHRYVLLNSEISHPYVA